MLISWIALIGALAVLLPPPWLPEPMRRTVMSPRRNERVNPLAAVRAWQNWVDFARACIGTLLLTGAAMQPNPVQPNSSSNALVTQAGLLVLALLPQIVRLNLKTSRPEQRIQVIAPIFYLAGVVLAFAGWASGGFAVAVAAAFTAGGKKLSFALPTMMIALVGAGYVFGLSVNVMFAVVLSCLPFAVAFTLRKTLAFVGNTSFAPAPAPAKVAVS